MGVSHECAIFTHIGAGIIIGIGIGYWQIHRDYQKKMDKMNVDLEEQFRVSRDAWNKHYNKVDKNDFRHF
jgi:hypothetical protein